MIPIRHSISNIARSINTNGSMPVVVMADDFEDYICKYDYSSKLINEYLAHCFLRVWNLPVFDASLVSIKQDHVIPEIICNRLQKHHFNKPAFGLKYDNEALDVSNVLLGLHKDYTELNKFINRNDFIKIALFDLWVANTDRNINNYNILIRPEPQGNRLIPIDHTDIFDTCRLGHSLCQLTEDDSVLSSDLARVMILNNKKTQGEVKDLLLKFSTFVTECGKLLPSIINSIPAEWCIDKPLLESNISQSIFQNADWLKETIDNFKELIHKHIR
jgi:hypothetical protein